MYILYKTDTGEILCVQDKAVDVSGYETIYIGNLDLPAAHYVDLVTLLIVPRPVLTEFQDGIAPLDLVSSGLPAGTLVEVTNNAGQKVDNTDVNDTTITLTDPGSYLVEVTPPFPYIPYRKNIEVTNA